MLRLWVRGAEVIPGRRCSCNDVNENVQQSQSILRVQNVTTRQQELYIDLFHSCLELPWACYCNNVMGQSSFELNGRYIGVTSSKAIMEVLEWDTGPNCENSTLQLIGVVILCTTRFQARLGQHSLYQLGPLYAGNVTASIENACSASEHGHLKGKIVTGCQLLVRLLNSKAGEVLTELNTISHAQSGVTNFLSSSNSFNPPSMKCEHEGGLWSYVHRWINFEM